MVTYRPFLNAHLQDTPDSIGRSHANIIAIRKEFLARRHEGPLQRLIEELSARVVRESTSSIQVGRNRISELNGRRDEAARLELDGLAGILMPNGVRDPCGGRSDSKCHGIDAGLVEARRAVIPVVSGA